MSKLLLKHFKILLSIFCSVLLLSGSGSDDTNFWAIGFKSAISGGLGLRKKRSNSSLVFITVSYET